jgi:hypothetical protein
MAVLGILVGFFHQGQSFPGEIAGLFPKYLEVHLCFEYNPFLTSRQFKLYPYHALWYASPPAL